jgi:hypothetical protein
METANHQHQQNQFLECRETIRTIQLLIAIFALVTGTFLLGTPQFTQSLFLDFTLLAAFH